MRIKIIIILTCIISSCSGTKNLTELSELTIENRTTNNLIVDRNPEYGIDGRDGCVVMDEISMYIAELNEKSITGKVFDSKTKEPLINAKLILLINNNGQTESKIITANSDGFYKTELNGELEKIEVEYIAYRNLIIDLKKK